MKIQHFRNATMVIEADDKVAALGSGNVELVDIETMLVTTHDNPQLADNWEAWLTIKQFTRPFVTIMSDGDQVTRGSEKRFIREVPGCKNQPHVILEGGNHFLQEDIPEQLTRALVAWLKATPGVINTAS